MDRIDRTLYGMVLGFCLLSASAPVFGGSQIAVEEPLAGPYTQTLQKFGLEPTRESLQHYLQSLHPDPEAVQAIRDLIAQLGHPDFQKREAATKTLLKSPVHLPELLEAAMRESDPEIRWRAKQIWKLARGRSSRILYAAFSVIEQGQITGLAEPILSAFPLCKAPYLERKAAAALAVVATVDDVETLKWVAMGTHEIAGRNLAARTAAIAALERVLGSDADPILEELQNASQPMKVQVAVARAQLNHGNRTALASLGRLLSAEELEVRLQAIRALRSSTPERFGYSPYEGFQSRQVAAEAWREWIANNSTTAELTLPLRDIDVLLGRTLLTNYTQREVIELDHQHNVIWRAEVNGAWGCEGLPNGHRLIASYTGKFLVEFDAAGDEVWRFEELPDKPYSVQRLPNGNTLVPCYGGQLLEIRPDKSIAWELELPERAKSAQMLESGNILLVLYNSGRVVEINRDGTIVWEVEGMERPYSVQRLPNGHTLVANRTENRVVEINRAGEELWSYQSEPSLYRAQRLPDGHTLIVSSAGLVEVDSAGNVVWSREEAGLRGADRY
ncbi:outer membrane protein assembly factor BamB family protein [Thalassoroseus pseudoceratinae]|uniref:outer membrane protein assembly factor BamB family protein n=1 Tax=Thalassoroseus pseudoceratinae TaxID=2713176 RepID=UPI0014225CED|nr:PQQ-binding-like beta-propeller repeat protein [Thalassoroseus pseudoceratinae]